MKALSVKFIPLSIIFGEYDDYAELLCNENPGDWGWGTNDYTLVSLHEIRDWLHEQLVRVPDEDEEEEAYVIDLLLGNCDAVLARGVYLVDLEN